MPGDHEVDPIQYEVDRNIALIRLTHPHKRNSVSQEVGETAKGVSAFLEKRAPK